jgi:hypothetical protein
MVPCQSYALPLLSWQDRGPYKSCCDAVPRISTVSCPSCLPELGMIQYTRSRDMEAMSHVFLNPVKAKSHVFLLLLPFRRSLVHMPSNSLAAITNLRFFASSSV